MSFVNKLKRRRQALRHFNPYVIPTHTVDKRLLSVNLPRPKPSPFLPTPRPPTLASRGNVTLQALSNRSNSIRRPAKPDYCKPLIDQATALSAEICALHSQLRKYKKTKKAKPHSLPSKTDDPAPASTSNAEKLLLNSLTRNLP
jgi:hypothetical protein